MTTREELKKRSAQSFIEYLDGNMLRPDEDDSVTVQHGVGDYRAWSGQDFYEEGYIEAIREVLRWCEEEKYCESCMRNDCNCVYGRFVVAVESLKARFGEGGDVQE